MTSYDGLSQAISCYSTPVKVLEWQTSLGFKPLSNDKTFVIRDCGFHVMNYRTTAAIYLLHRNCTGRTTN